MYLYTDEETGGYVSYQCVLPMLVHGSGYVQMQMISNSKAEKLVCIILEFFKKCTYIILFIYILISIKKISNHTFTNYIQIL